MEGTPFGNLQSSQNQKLERMTKILCSPNPIGVGTRFVFSKFWSSFSFDKFNSRKKKPSGIGGWGVGGLIRPLVFKLSPKSNFSCF
jgi:hypothetical protein